MTPKLTPAQQRVYEWFAKSPDNMAEAESDGRFHLYHREYHPPTRRSSTIAAVVPYLHRLDTLIPRYIHPDHAPEGRNDG